MSETRKNPPCAVAWCSLLREPDSPYCKIHRDHPALRVRVVEDTECHMCGGTGEIIDPSKMATY